MNEKIEKLFREMKAKHPDAVLLFRVGDFYESYGEDAETVAKELGIILTNQGETKTAAFPHQSLDQYLPKLVRAGKRVAFCDQIDEPQPPVKRDEAPVLGEVKKIFIQDIHPSPMNPRKTFDEEGINELAESIMQHGLLQPITVRPDGDGKYEVVMGERRYRAWKRNTGNPRFPSDIPCIVREMNDEEALEAMITENLQRKDVDPIEEAFAFGQLHAHGKSIEEIAERFGKSKRFITERIKLDNLLPELKKMVTDDKLHIGAAMHICKLTEDEQRQFLEWCDDQDEVTKHDAVEFTDDLFMTIGRADWDKEFEGACHTTCGKCPYNNANVGCLFYEMKPHNATCTSRERWDRKRLSWLQRIVDDNAGVLVKSGESLETGKTLAITSTCGAYADRCPEYEPLIEHIKSIGAEVASRDDYFDSYTYYREDDSRLQDMLAKNEVYRCLAVEQGWRGTEIHIRYFRFKKEVAEERSDDVKAMQLVSEYKENERKNATNLAAKLRGILGDMEPSELSTEPLSQTESLVLMTLILRKCSHKFRTAAGLTAYSSGPQVLDYMRGHAAQAQQICRDYLREELSSAGVEYSADLQDCQWMLLQEWAKEQAEEIAGEFAQRLAKKQRKIEDQLTTLGYNVDGTKMDF